MKKIQNIQALRGIAVLLVVFFHLIPIEKKYGGSETIIPDFFNVGMLGVDIFFVISGFIMISITRGKFQNRKHAMTFIYHRFSRIYPTYWVYSLLVLGVFLLKPALVNSSQGNDANILASFLLWPSEKLPLLMVGWTLIHEMYFYLVFFAIILLTPEKHITSTLLIWGVTIICMNIFLVSKMPIEKLIFSPLTIEFILGCFIAIYLYRNESTAHTPKVLLFTAFIAFILAIIGLIVYKHYTNFSDPQEWWRILILGVPAFIIVFCFSKAEQHGFFVHPSLVKIGDCSYSIYLSHILTLSLAGRIWKEFSNDSTWDNYIMIPLLLLLTIIIGILSYNYLEKPLLTYSRRFG